MKFSFSTDLDCPKSPLLYSWIAFVQFDQRDVRNPESGRARKAFRNAKRANLLGSFGIQVFPGAPRSVYRVLRAESSSTFTCSSQHLTAQSLTHFHVFFVAFRFFLLGARHRKSSFGRPREEEKGGEIFWKAERIRKWGMEQCGWLSTEMRVKVRLETGGRLGFRQEIGSCSCRMER